MQSRGLDKNLNIRLLLFFYRKARCYFWGKFIQFLECPHNCSTQKKDILILDLSGRSSCLPQFNLLWSIFVFLPFILDKSQMSDYLNIILHNNLFTYSVVSLFLYSLVCEFFFEIKVLRMSHRYVSSFLILCLDFPGSCALGWPWCMRLKVAPQHTSVYFNLLQISYMLLNFTGFDIFVMHLHL